jgi:polyphenol oxidase
VADKTRSLAQLDDFLTKGGFSRAKRPKGALARQRSARDKQLAAAKAKAKPVRKHAMAHKFEIIIADSKAWNQPWLVHGFSTRAGGFTSAFGMRGDLNLGFGKHDSREAVEKNRKKFFASLGGKGMTLISPKQIHSSDIKKISAAPKDAITTDGLITNVPGILLTIQTADCVPILLVDVKKKVIGAFHAGWRGTVARIVEKGVGTMRAEFGSDPKDIHAAIGPCIAQCCYAVGEEVIDQFRSQFEYADKLFKPYFDDDPVKNKYPLLFMTARAPGHSNLGPQIHLDLVEANRRQLQAAGVPARNIWSADECTSCDTKRFFSHRKEDGFTGRMMAAVGLV